MTKTKGASTARSEDDSIDFDLDFGFSFTDDTKELSAIQDNAAQEVQAVQERLDALLAAVIPFLNNLCKNPEKDTIHWPNRVEKIEAYKKKLERIARGNT